MSSNGEITRFSPIGRPNRAFDDSPHDRRADAISEQPDAIASSTVAQVERVWRYHSLLEFGRLMHAQCRLVAFALD